MADEKTVITAITLLEEMFPHSEKRSKAAQSIFIEMFSDVPDEILISAAKTHIRKGKFFPTVAELLEICQDLENPSGGLAIEAWGEVVAYLKDRSCDVGRKLGRYPQGATEEEKEKQLGEWLSHKDACPVCQGRELPTFSDPNTLRVVEAMGIENLRKSDNQVADRAHFMKAFEQVDARQKKEQVMLPEIKELANQKRIGAGDGKH